MTTTAAYVVREDGGSHGDETLIDRTLDATP
jgi:hypothetical protein